jgi:hypothetical protein
MFLRNMVLAEAKAAAERSKPNVGLARLGMASHDLA